jgi:hypothetical protein
VSFGRLACGSGCANSGGIDGPQVDDFCLDPLLKGILGFHKDAQH